MSICKVIKIILTILGKVTVIEPTGDVTLKILPGEDAQFNVVLRNNGPKDIPVTLAMSDAPAGVVFTPPTGIAEANADTTIPVAVLVGAAAVPGEYTVELTVAQ